MYCPKCGNELVTVDGELQCIKGQMGLSANLARRFIDCFVSKTETPQELAFSFIVGGRWYCPACGISTVEKDGFIRCTQCELSLNEFIGVLVERHPHT